MFFTFKIIDAALENFHRIPTPRTRGVMVIPTTIRILLYGITNSSSVQLPLYIRRFRGMVPKAKRVDRVEIVKLETKSKLFITSNSRLKAFGKFQKFSLFKAIGQSY